MNVGDALRTALRGHLSAISIATVIDRHVTSSHLPTDAMDRTTRESIAERVVNAASLFSRTDATTLRAMIRGALELDGSDDSPLRDGPTSVPIRAEVDVSVARNEARRIAVEAGVSGSTAVKVATGVSELARNIVLYAGRGSIDLDVARDARGPSVIVVAQDQGPGIEKDRLEAMFAGTYRSKTGLGKGLAAVKRIAASFELDTEVGRGTTVRIVFREAR